MDFDYINWKFIKQLRKAFTLKNYLAILIEHYYWILGKLHLGSQKPVNRCIVFRTLQKSAELIKDVYCNNIHQMYQIRNALQEMENKLQERETWDETYFVVPYSCKLFIKDYTVNINSSHQNPSLGLQGCS